MKKLFTLAVLILFIPDILNAQNVLLSQDFSSSTNVDDYIGSGAGQLNLGSSFPTPTDPANSWPGLASKNIANAKLQLDLRSTYSGTTMGAAAAAFSRNIGSARLIKLQFKLDYSRLEDGAAPKPAIFWLNNQALLYFGRDNSSEYFISDFDMPYYLSGGYFNASTHTGPGGNKFNGEHLVTVLMNFTAGSLKYNSETVNGWSLNLYIDGIFQKRINWQSGRTYNDPIITFMLETGRFQYNTNFPPNTKPEIAAATHRIVIDDLLIEDLSGALPVKLIDFTVKKEQNSATMQWKTSEEINGDYFEIEHSANAKNWQVLDQVIAIGDTKELSKYSYSHQNIPIGINYYRLKMVDLDGTFAYSVIKSVLNKEENNLKIFPNPVTDRLFIESNYLTKITSVQINDIQGKQVIALTNNIRNGIVISSLSPGSYIVIIQQEDGSKSSKRFFVQK